MARSSKTWAISIATSQRSSLWTLNHNTSPFNPKTRLSCRSGRATHLTRGWLRWFRSSNVRIFHAYFRGGWEVQLTNVTAIAIYKPPDVRPIIKAYEGKNIPIEYAKKEAEAKRQFLEEWRKSGKGKISSGGFTLSGLFGSSSQVIPSLTHHAFYTEIHLTYYISGAFPRATHIPWAETQGGTAALPRGTSVHRC